MRVEELFSKEIIELLKDEELFNEAIHDSISIRFLLREVYYILPHIPEDNSIDFETRKKLYIMATIYESFYKNDEIPSVVASIDDVREKVDDKISKMYTIDDIDSFDRYYKDIKSVIEYQKDFSLEEQYMTFNGIELVYELNGACVITPTQTIARYNGKDSFNGDYGVGYHDDNFRGILNSVYGRSFDDNYSGQDVKIRFVNTKYERGQCRGMTIEIPVPINSSQVFALNKLNTDIKKIRETGIEINIEVSMIKKDGTLYHNGKYKDLDSLLPNLVVDDYIKYKYKEEFFVGQNNFENVFIKNRKEFKY